MRKYTLQGGFYVVKSKCFSAATSICHMWFSLSRGEMVHALQSFLLGGLFPMLKVKGTLVCAKNHL